MAAGGPARGLAGRHDGRASPAAAGGCGPARPPSRSQRRGPPRRRASARACGVASCRATCAWRGRRFEDGWLLADRIGAAGGNAESLLVSLLEAKVGNPWLVVERASPDWARLAAAHGDRLVAMGSRRLAAARRERELGAGLRSASPTWSGRRRSMGHAMRPHLQLGLLGDGVAVDDGSRQLRPGTVDLFLTTTPAETKAFVADGTPFALTAKEVARTGMPRLDRLRALADGGAAPDLVLVAPDTRDWLTVPLDAEHGRIDRLARPTAGASDYATRWRSILGVSRRSWRPLQRRGTAGRVPAAPGPRVGPRRGVAAGWRGAAARRRRGAARAAGPCSGAGDRLPAARVRRRLDRPPGGVLPVRRGGAGDRRPAGPERDLRLRARRVRPGRGDGRGPCGRRRGGAGARTRRGGALRRADRRRVPRPRHAGLDAGRGGDPGAQPAVGATRPAEPGVRRQPPAPVSGYRPS